MKCPNCGAEIGNSRQCPYCGSQISYDMLREQEQLNKAGCPRCGSTNITFTRENQGEIRGKNTKRVIHQTVGFCKDCGYTWYTSGGNAPIKKRKTWLWVLGWLFIFPVPLTILMLRQKNMKPALRYGIIAAAWIVYLIIGLNGKSSDTETAEAPVTESVTTTPEATPATEVEENKDNNQLLDVDIKVDPQVNEEDGSVLFGVTTNLPESTELIVTVSNDTYTAQDNVVILNSGTGYTSEFSDNGAALEGTYNVSVSMNPPSLQKEAVQEVIGKNGEFLTGKFVTKSSTDSSNTVSGNFEFTFEGLKKDPESEESAAVSDDEIRPEIKEAIDSYEQFIDEYIAFMETYDANDTTMLAKYADFVSKYAEYSEKMDAFDDEQDLTDAEEKYYTEVSLRVSQKLLEASEKIGS